ncbi:DUF551 domain-containing protein [Escherichia coli]|nr:hypothetical protein A9K64_07145 [Escherichia coli]EIP3821568.1 DUF551 domain-containing protein [Escherichia coli]EMD3191911.1 DUF551 domain-containing protein [Escherichia coli]MGI58393.1 DUF551 domain-containing protein [Escherichia coli]HCP4551471.1 DUF551 domain-containing protein [Escherichia coli]
MTTITKERLLTIKEWRETYGPGSNVVLPAEEAEELARIALASLEAKPIGAFHIAEQQVDGTSDYLKDGEWPIDNGIIEVYAAPPVPVVPAALPENDDEDGHDIDYLEPSEVYALGRTAGWNACRAAMLQAEPVSNSDELPLDYLQGHKDGLEWAAQQAEANHPQTGDWLYDDPIDLARAIRKGPDMPTVQGGNSPVTPDGWISCSERMPAQDDWILIYSKHGEYMAGQVQEEYVELSDGTLSWLGNALYWMPLPEPPQEVN